MMSIKEYRTINMVIKTSTLLSDAVTEEMEGSTCVSNGLANGGNN